MPSRILLQREELWELRAGPGANGERRVRRLRRRQVHRCVEWHAKMPNYGSLDVGVGGGVEGQARSQSY